MAECLITAAWSCPSCDDKFQIPGIQRDAIWVGNRTEIQSYTSTVEGEISAMVFDSYKGLFKVCVHRDSASFTEELASENTSGYYYNQNLTFRVIDDSRATKEAIEGMVGVDLVFIVKKRNNKFVVIGQDFGVRMTENSKTTGSAAGDETGDTMTFTGEALSKANYFLNTSVVITESLLDDYIV